jgi:hypothetical protein
VSRLYLPVLRELQEKGVAELTVSKDMLITVINGVKKIKAEDNVARQDLDMMRMNRLVIKKKEIRPGFFLVTFTFTTDTLRL